MPDHPVPPSPSVLRERIEDLWERTRSALDRVAETGETAALPGLLSQGLKNLELLAKLTGELQSTTSNVAIQIVIPGNGVERRLLSDGAVEIQLPRRR